jgi:RimJ/RimL family protein N-acetyltransferase
MRYRGSAVGTDMKLRKFTSSDAPRIAALVGDYEVSRWTSNIPHPYDAHNAIAWMEFTESDVTRHPHAVEVDGEVVACVSYWPYESDGTEVGYWVGKEYWGKGIATQALQLLLAMESFPNTERIVAKVMDGNFGSVRVLEKCGFSIVKSCNIQCRGIDVPSSIFVRAENK